MFVVNPPGVGDANRFPAPSANTRPTVENTLALFRPDSRAPIGVLLKVNAPVVPGGVAGTGTRGADPPAVVPGGVAPSKKKPALKPVIPYDPTTSPFPEQVRA